MSMQDGLSMCAAGIISDLDEEDGPTHEEVVDWDLPDI